MFLVFLLIVFHVEFAQRSIFVHVLGDRTLADRFDAHETTKIECTRHAVADEHVLGVAGQERDLVHHGQTRPCLAVRVVVKVERIHVVRILETRHVFVLLNELVAEAIARTVCGVLVSGGEIVVMNVLVSASLRKARDKIRLLVH